MKLFGPTLSPRRSASRKKFGHDEFLNLQQNTDPSPFTAAMSTQTTAKKRKSADGTSSATKKIRITKSADRPSPVKSALKKTKAVEKPTTNGDAVVQTSTAYISDNEDGEEDGGTRLTPSQTAALLAGFSSSDSEAEADNEEAGRDISSLPKPPAPSKTQTQKESDPETTPGTIYLGRIPHGFHEPQMRAYFSQFGPITHLRLARNPKTGKSRHYAFIEFASASVAEIVARTMDKYLLFGHLLQVRVVPAEQLKGREGMWRGEGRRGWNVRPRNKIEGGRLRRGASRGVWEGRVEREVARREAKAEKLREMGYEFEMPAVKGVGEVPLKGKQTEEGVEGEGGVKLLENGETTAPAVDAVQAEADGIKVATEEKVTKKRPAHGTTQVKKVVKKVRT